MAVNNMDKNTRKHNGNNGKSIEVAVVETNLTDEVRKTIAKKLGEELILLVEDSHDELVDTTNSVL